MPGGIYIPLRAPVYHPIKDPATAEWGLKIDRADYEKLLKGFTPRSMEDKWLCNTDRPDHHGNTTVHWYGGWANTEVFTIAVDVIDADNSEAKDWAVLTKITWEKVVGSQEIDAEGAKADVVSLCRWGMNCELR